MSPNRPYSCHIREHDSRPIRIYFLRVLEPIGIIIQGKLEFRSDVTFCLSLSSFSPSNEACLCCRKRHLSGSSIHQNPHRENHRGRQLSCGGSLVTAWSFHGSCWSRIWSSSHLPTEDQAVVVAHSTFLTDSPDHEGPPSSRVPERLTLEASPLLLLSF